MSMKKNSRGRPSRFSPEFRRDAGSGLGGRLTPAGAIDRAYTPGRVRSVCAANARALFDSPAALDVAVMRLRVLDSTGPRPR